MLDQGLHDEHSSSEVLSHPTQTLNKYRTCVISGYKYPVLVDLYVDILVIC